MAQNTKTVSITINEAEARKLTKPETSDDVYEMMIKGVFGIMWANAIDIDHITKIICSVNRMDESNMDVDRISKILTQFTRKKILRSFKSGKTRLYELNI